MTQVKSSGAVIRQGFIPGDSVTSAGRQGLPPQDLQVQVS